MRRVVKMTFEVIEDYDLITDDKTLKEEYDGDIHKLCCQLTREEGIWWDNPLKLVKTEILELEKGG